MENLPKEVLLIILDYLDNSSLKSCLLVSHQFRNLILNSAILMRKLPLILNESQGINKIEFIKKHGNLVKTIIVKDHLFYLSDLLKFTLNLNKLVLVDKSFQYQVNQQLMKIIDMMNEEVLKSLQIQPLPKIINFSDHLQHLTIIINNEFSTQEIFMKFYNINSLKIFKLFIKSIRQENFLLIKKFISNQKNLQELSISNLPIDDKFFENYHEMKFKLKKLTLGWDFMKATRNLEQKFPNFYKFLNSQQEYLEVMNLGHCGAYDETIEESKHRFMEWMLRAHFKSNLQKNLKLIYDTENFPLNESKKFKNLKKLRYWFCDSFNCSIPNQEKLIELDVLYHENFTTIDGLKNYFRNFVSLEKLFIRCFDDVNDNFLIFIYENRFEFFKIFKKLKGLKISTYGYVIFTFTKLQNDEIKVEISTMNYESCAHRIVGLISYFNAIKTNIVEKEKFEKILDI
ncbi:hypothetical protein PVAND_015543 [Polypedilum vanderplanki]|uniref:F-box domain-containing protein n=1 Tax=Polypedilum vanderplanki TaxID=319348 RepID=A0A9J6BDE2_POLVA|nr:hypothetical protein PVAND_015543 [Polypedilum vanderplanki]